MACNALCITFGICLAGLIAVVVGAVIGWVVVPNIVRSKIADILPLKQNTESWERWQNPPLPIYFSVYVYHVNNPDDILNGAIPNVTEKGPYVYREKRIKNISYVNEEESSVFYKQKLLFEFDQKASGELTEDDMLTVVNLPALALFQIVDNLRAMRSVIQMANTAVHKMWPTPNLNPLFIRSKVKDYLFGRLPIYCNQTISAKNLDTKILCEALRLISPKTIDLDYGRKGLHTFSFFRYKNDSLDGTYQIDLGINDVTQIGNIKSWSGLTELANWKGESCNRIMGTDGAIFRPYLMEDDVQSLYIYNTDACRSFKLSFDSFSEYKDVSGVKFVMDKKVFGSVLENSDNYCYCPQSIKGITNYGGCLKDGVVELSTCHGAPVVISHPHFLMADSSYKKIIGLKPDVVKHQTFLELEPYTGYPLSAASRIQINVFLKRIEEVKLMKNFINILMPAIWMEESVQLTDELIGDLHAQLLNNLIMIDIARWIIIGLGISLSLAAAAYYLTKLRQWNR